MNRTLKEATVKRYPYESHAQLREHLTLFWEAHNFAKQPKTLRGLTPHEHDCQIWNTDPDCFKKRPDPSHFRTVQVRLQTVRHGH